MPPFDIKPSDACPTPALCFKEMQDQREDIKNLLAQLEATNKKLFVGNGEVSIVEQVHANAESIKAIVKSGEQAKSFRNALLLALAIQMAVWLVAMMKESTLLTNMLYQNRVIMQQGFEGLKSVQDKNNQDQSINNTQQQKNNDAVQDQGVSNAGVK